MPIKKIIKDFIYINRYEISLSIILLCILIIIYACNDYKKIYKHEGLPSLILNSASYLTTTFAIIIPLLFFDTHPNP